MKLEDSGLWVKLKSDWYFAQSKSHMKLPNKERELWKMVRGKKTKKKKKMRDRNVSNAWLKIFEGTIDDLLPQLTEEVRAQVELFTQKLLEQRLVSENFV